MAVGRGKQARDVVTCMLAILPPILVVVLMQRWFVKGLVETEK